MINQSGINKKNLKKFHLNSNHVIFESVFISNSEIFENKKIMKPNHPTPHSSFASNWGNTVLKYRYLVLALSVATALLLGFGGQFIRFDSDYHVFFSEENPELKAFDDLQAKYTQDDNVLIVIEPQNGDVFTPEHLSAIEELTEQSWQTPFSSRVDAITNYQHTRAEGDDLFVEDLVENADSKSSAEIAEIKKIATSEPLLVNRLVNESGSITAVNITVKLPGKDINEVPSVIEYVRNITAEFESNHPELKTYLSGIVMLNGAFFESSMKDMGTLIPLMFLVIIATIYLTTRSISGTLTTIVIIFLSIMTAMGAAGWMGIGLTPPSAAAPTIIMTLAIADSIHVLITMLQSMRSGLGKRAAIIESLRLNFMPVFITSITTIIGFLTLNFSEVPPFNDLGNMTAIGMAAAFLFSVTTLPALMDILPVRVKVNPNKQKAIGSSWMNGLANFVANRPKPILWVGSLMILGLSYLSLNNELSDEFLKYFDHSIAFRNDTDFISDNLTGIYNVEYSLGSGESGGINNPAYLKHLSDFEQWLKQQPEVVHVNSYVDVARRVNKSMHGDSLKYYTVPTNREEAAQYLLLYEMSLPFGLDLNNQINVDKSETRLTATVENISSSEMIAFTERTEHWLDEHTPEYMQTNGTSATLMFSHMTKRQINSLINGTILAIALISAILMLALRSFGFGLLSLIPNVTPILVGFGVWGLLNGVINSGIAIVFGMTLGIIVDDTVHFLSKYLRARRELGKDAREAVKYAFSTVGNALVVTTVVLVAGFAILAQSSFGMNSGMAKITVLIITIALAIDFLILPALLIVTSRGDSKQQKINVEPSFSPVG